MLVVEWLQREKYHGLQDIDNMLHWRWIRYILYATFFVAIIYFSGDYTEFIYFQF